MKSPLGRLLYAFELVQQEKSLIENQLDRMADRTAAGVDINGRPFKPYKHQPKDGRRVPLGRGGDTLIKRAKISASTSLGEGGLRATMDGTTGKIGAYQNKMRPFWGFSENDKEATFGDFMRALKDRM